MTICDISGLYLVSPRVASQHSALLGIPFQMPKGTLAPQHPSRKECQHPSASLQVWSLTQGKNHSSLWGINCLVFKLSVCCEMNTTFQSIDNVRINQQRIWPRHKNWPIKTIPMIPNYLP